MSAPRRTRITGNITSFQEDVVEESWEDISTNAPNVRTLKPPPEIWELVPVPTKEFKPRRAFATRLASSSTKLILLPIAVGVIVGVGIAVWRVQSPPSHAGSSSNQAATTKESVL